MFSKILETEINLSKLNIIILYHYKFACFKIRIRRTHLVVVTVTYIYLHQQERSENTAYHNTFLAGTNVST